MKIAGLDLSMNGTGCVSFTLDEKLNIIEHNYMGFCGVKKHESDKVHLLRKKDYNNRYQMNEFARDEIVKFCKGADKIAIEDYAFGGSGNVFDIAEYTGYIRMELLKEDHELRLYDPNTIKKYATGDGRSDKIAMYQAYDKVKQNIKPDIKSLPEPTRASGVSPTSDIVDAYWIARLLQLELKLRRGLVNLKDLDETKIQIFNRVTKSFPENILVRDFLKM